MGVSKGGRLDCCTLKCVAGQLGCQGRQDGGGFDTVWFGLGEKAAMVFVYVAGAAHLWGPRS